MRSRVRADGSVEDQLRRSGPNAAPPATYSCLTAPWSVGPLATAPPACTATAPTPAGSSSMGASAVWCSASRRAVTRQRALRPGCNTHRRCTYVAGAIVRTVIIAAGTAVVGVAALVACSSGDASKPKSTPDTSSASPSFTTHYGQDAAIIASHITGCTNVAAGSVGGGATTGMSSTASCTLDGHTVIVDGWAAADDTPDMAALMKGNGHLDLCVRDRMDRVPRRRRRHTGPDEPANAAHQRRGRPVEARF